MSELSQSLSDIQNNLESNQEFLSRLPSSLQNDPIITENIDAISNKAEFLELVSVNAEIFNQTDNLSAQKTFLIQSLKGLEY